MFVPLGKTHMSKFDKDYIPSDLEKEAYCYGYASVDYGVFELDIFPNNPYCNFRETLLWEAWEVGFNDAFEDAVRENFLSGRGR